MELFVDVERTARQVRSLRGEIASELIFSEMNEKAMRNLLLSKGFGHLVTNNASASQQHQHYQHQSTYDPSKEHLDELSKLKEQNQLLESALENSHKYVIQLESLNEDLVAALRKSETSLRQYEQTDEELKNTTSKQLDERLLDAEHRVESARSEIRLRDRLVEELQNQLTQTQHKLKVAEEDLKSEQKTNDTLRKELNDAKEEVKISQQTRSILPSISSSNTTEEKKKEKKEEEQEDGNTKKAKEKLRESFVAMEDRIGELNAKLQHQLVEAEIHRNHLDILKQLLVSAQQDDSLFKSLRSIASANIKEPIVLDLISDLEKLHSAFVETSQQNSRTSEKRELELLEHATKVHDELESASTQVLALQRELQSMKESSEKENSEMRSTVQRELELAKRKVLSQEKELDEYKSKVSQVEKKLSVTSLVSSSSPLMPQQLDGGSNVSSSSSVSWKLAFDSLRQSVATDETAERSKAELYLRLSELFYQELTGNLQSSAS